MTTETHGEVIRKSALTSRSLLDEPRQILRKPTALAMRAREFACPSHHRHIRRKSVIAVGQC